MHEVRQYRTALPGVEVVSLKSLRQFPRHSHDQFGIGVINSGGHRSWSGLGWVEAICGDIIMVNPGEMHDGHSLEGKPRSWTMLFFEPRIACDILVDGQANSIPTLCPAVRDRAQALRFGRLFDAVTDPQPDALRLDQEFVTTVAHAFLHHASHRPLRSFGLPSIQRIVRIIDREPERPLSLQAMADMAGVSRFHLLTGIFPSHRCNAARLYLAAACSSRTPSPRRRTRARASKCRLRLRRSKSHDTRLRSATWDDPCSLSASYLRAEKSNFVQDSTRKAIDNRSMIRPCTPEDCDEIWTVINDGASAYRGVIPADCLREPYMTHEKLRRRNAGRYRLLGGGREWFIRGCHGHTARA